MSLSCSGLYRFNDLWRGSGANATQVVMQQEEMRQKGVRPKMLAAQKLSHNFW